VVFDPENCQFLQNLYFLFFGDRTNLHCYCHGIHGRQNRIFHKFSGLPNIRTRVEFDPLIFILFMALTTQMVELSLSLGILIGACIMTGSLNEGFKVWAVFSWRLSFW